MLWVHKTDTNQFIEANGSADTRASCDPPAAACVRSAHDNALVELEW
jgi:hypothetical protein